MSHQIEIFNAAGTRVRALPTKYADRSKAIGIAARCYDEVRSQAGSGPWHGARAIDAGGATVWERDLSSDYLGLP